MAELLNDKEVHQMPAKKMIDKGLSVFANIKVDHFRANDNKKFTNSSSCSCMLE